MATRPARRSAAGSDPAPRSFRTAAAFRAWLERHHGRAAVLVLRLWRTHAAHRGITYAVALDEALCFGWIDGVRRAHDADSFTVRFTPRRAGSRWSLVNRRHYARLEAAGRVRPPGRAAFRAAATAAAGYSFESRPAEWSPELLKTFRRERAAWAWFARQAPWYRRTCAHWVMSARRDDTRARRLAALIAACAAGRAVGPLGSARVRA